VTRYNSDMIETPVLLPHHPMTALYAQIAGRLMG
jgi:hypothetical protein